jgi:hypothetical protein
MLYNGVCEELENHLGGLLEKLEQTPPVDGTESDLFMRGFVEMWDEYKTGLLKLSQVVNYMVSHWLFTGFRELTRCDYPLGSFVRSTRPSPPSHQA